MTVKRSTHKTDEVPLTPTPSRSAVEIAIRLSKEDKSSTWEGSVEKRPRRISRWEDKESAAK